MLKSKEFSTKCKESLISTQSVMETDSMKNKVLGLLEDFLIVLDEYSKILEQDGLMLKHIDKRIQNEYLCLIAVEQNGLALQYVGNQNVKICLTAVKQNGLALQYVSDELKFNYEIRDAARIKDSGEAKQNKLAEQYLDDRYRTVEL